MSLHPLEVLFVKVKASMLDAQWPGQAAAVRYQAWLERRLPVSGLPSDGLNPSPSNSRAVLHALADPSAALCAAAAAAALQRLNCHRDTSTSCWLHARLLAARLTQAKSRSSQSAVASRTAAAGRRQPHRCC